MSIKDLRIQRREILANGGPQAKLLSPEASQQASRHSVKTILTHSTTLLNKSDFTFA